jgi:hypothetical protein
MDDDVIGGRRSRRDRGMTALIEGFFGFVWFGWGQANAPAGLRVGLAVGAVAAVLVALAGGVQAFRSPASTGVLHDRHARRRYGVAVGVEFSLAGVGAAVLAVAGQSDSFRSGCARSSGCTSSPWRRCWKTGCSWRSGRR